MLCKNLTQIHQYKHILACIPGKYHILLGARPWNHFASVRISQTVSRTVCSRTFSNFFVHSLFCVIAHRVVEFTSRFFRAPTRRIYFKWHVHRFQMFNKFLAVKSCLNTETHITTTFIIYQIGHAKFAPTGRPIYCTQCTVVEVWLLLGLIILKENNCK